MVDQNKSTDEQVRRFSGWGIAMLKERPATEYVLASDYNAERTKRLQAEHERDCAVETLAAVRIFLLDNGPMKLIAPMVDRLDKALGFVPLQGDVGAPTDG